MDDIWIISWFSHTAFDANPIWKSPTLVPRDTRYRPDIAQNRRNMCDKVEGFF